MEMKRLIAVLAVSVSALIIVIINKYDVFAMLPLKQVTQNETGIHLDTNCKEESNIFYLKVHKTGSTTLSNILYNFGVSRNLSFPYNEAVLRDTLPHPNDLLEGTKRQHKFNIMALHTILDMKEIHSLMPLGTKVVVSLRHPLPQLQSAIIFFKLHLFFSREQSRRLHRKVVLGPQDILEVLLRDSNVFMHNMDKTYNVYPRELGMDMNKVHSSSYVKQYLSYLDTVIDGVIITEHFDESLLLLRKKFCWSYKDILYVPMREQSYHFTLNDTHLTQHRKMDPANYAVYEHYLEKFQNQPILKSLSFQEEVIHFKDMLEQMKQYCICRCRGQWKSVYSQCKSSKITFKTSQYYSRFTITDDVCHRLMTLTRILYESVAMYQYQEVCRSPTKQRNYSRTLSKICKKVPREGVTLVDYLKDVPMPNGCRC